jgi:hypothetical protein
MSPQASLSISASWKRWMLVPLVVLSAAMLVGAHYRFLTSPARYVNEDFMTLWCGGRAVIEGIDPYDPDAWSALRARYGSTWMPNPRLPYPIWTAWLMVPFAALALDWAAACWLAFCELLVGACCLALMTQFGPHKPTLPEFGLVVLGAFAFRGTITNLINGQFTIVLLAVLTAFLVLSERKMPFWAGVALSGIAFKPNVFLVCAPLVALALAQRRAWRVLAGCGAGGAALLLMGWIADPGWLWPWLAVRGKTEATFKTPTVWGLAYDLFPAWWPVVGLCLAVLVVVFVGWFVLWHRELGVRQVVPLAIGGSLVVTPYVWAYEHALLLIPLVLLFVWIEERKLAWAVWILGSVVVPWTLYWVAIQRERDTMSWLVPLLVSVAFGVYVRWQIRCRQRGQ